MTSRSAVALIALPAAVALALSACGGGGGASSSSSPASSSAAPAPASSSGLFPSDAEFVTNACGVPGGDPTTPASAPEGTVVSGITITDTAVPSVTVQKGLEPALGLQTVPMADGAGKAAKATSQVTVDYCLVGQQSRTMIDSSWARGEPLTIGLNQVIPGWTQGVTGMKVGERAVLVIPGELGYGPNPPEGSGILPNETLIFVVDLLDVA